MITVHNAYQYVMGQVSVVNRTITAEDLGSAFADFCSKQTSEPPAFRDIAQDAGEAERFNSYFKAHQGDSMTATVDAIGDGWGAASIPGGYGAFMSRSEYIAPDADADADAAASVGADTFSYKPPSGGELRPLETDQDITVYGEPQALTELNAPLMRALLPVQALEDYGHNAPVAMADYRVAFMIDPMDFYERTALCLKNRQLSAIEV